MNALGRCGKRTQDTGVNPIRILTPTQEKFLHAFFERELPSEAFYLTGGTALSAYYLQHRYSDDLDFFTRDSGALRFAETRVQRASREADLQVDRVDKTPDAVRYFFSGDEHPGHPLRKVELMFDPPPYFAAPRVFEGVVVDDLLCIAVNKLTIHTRDDPKDYVDLYLIIRSGRYELENLIHLAKQKMVGLDELTIAAKFERVGDLLDVAKFQGDYMVTSVDTDELIRFYMEWAARLFSLLPPMQQE